jgi:hypothetical protein
VFVFPVCSHINKNSSPQYWNVRFPVLREIKKYIFLWIRIVLQHPPKCPWVCLFARAQNVFCSKSHLNCCWIPNIESSFFQMLLFANAVHSSIQLTICVLRHRYIFVRVMPCFLKDLKLNLEYCLLVLWTLTKFLSLRLCTLKIYTACSSEEIRKFIWDYTALHLIITYHSIFTTVRTLNLTVLRFF